MNFTSRWDTTFWNCLITYEKNWRNSKMKKKHQPVFPFVELDRKTGKPCGQFFGLTKLEYAMIHCNEPIPEWFKPEMPKRPKKPSSLDWTFGKNSNHPHKEAFVFWNDEADWWEEKEAKEKGVDIPESLKIEVKRWYRRWARYWNKNKQWEAEERVQRIVQWRKYFAEQLLK